MSRGLNKDNKFKRKQSNGTGIVLFRVSGSRARSRNLLLFTILATVAKQRKRKLTVEGSPTARKLIVLPKPCTEAGEENQKENEMFSRC